MFESETLKTVSNITIARFAGEQRLPETARNVNRKHAEGLILLTPCEKIPKLCP